MSWACHVAIGVLLVGLGLTSVVRADEYSLESVAAGPTGGDLAEAIVAQAASEGMLVKEGDDTLCQLWLAKEWPVAEGFTPTASLLYPFQVGQLLGMVHYESTGEDFRGQEIASGWYTIRYAQQPEDGNHVGTSETRDFLVLLPAADDTSPEVLETERLIELSKQAAQSNHPCMLALLRVETPAESVPVLTHDENRELWSIQVRGQTAGDDAPLLPLELVVVGKFPE